MHKLASRKCTNVYLDVCISRGRQRIVEKWLQMSLKDVSMKPFQAHKMQLIICHVQWLRPNAELRSTQSVHVARDKILKNIHVE